MLGRTVGEDIEAARGRRLPALNFLGEIEPALFGDSFFHLLFDESRHDIAVVQE